uniref:Homeobox domain-containing protein n=1 Tax=Panagrolaimus superbus TaxID=310955 RepID=A0A914Z914_9BILA
MATAATQLQITIITPQWLDPSEHEKENTSSSLQDQQEQEQNIETTNSNISITTTPTEDKTIRSQKIEPIHEWQKQKFDEWLSKNSFNMYPSRDEKEKLAEMLSASYLQITRLFANQRRRIHKKNKNTIKENDDLSIPPPTTKIPENSFKDESSEIGEENIEIPTVERSICSGSGSERSLSPPPSSTTSSSAFTLEENNIAAICSAVADQIHFDQENKKCLEKKPIQKTKSKKRKIKKISWDEKLLETTVDEILHKIGRKDSEVDDKRKEKESQQNTEVEIEVDNVEIEKSSKGLHFKTLKKHKSH